MKLLTDDIIRLRAVEPDDSYIMWEMEQDSEQWVHNGMAAPYSLHNLKEYSQNYDADPMHAGQLRLILELIKDKSVVGVIDLYEISPIHQTAFIGVYIRPQFRKRGYALKSIALLEEYSYKLLNICHIGAKVMADNLRSVELFNKAGYELRGVLPRWYRSGKSYHDLLLYSKLL